MKEHPITLFLIYILEELSKWLEAVPEDNLEATLKAFFGKKAASLIKSNILYVFVNSYRRIGLSQQQVLEIATFVPELNIKIQREIKSSFKNTWNS